jgi:Chromo (CHRromatin Organisation MOdifier) domain
MSKVFERLYHAWVLEFRERYLRWADPRARPWEHSCRKCDGKCGTPDDQMVLCDHCDAMYGFKCVSPPLKKAPKHAWHCPDCKPKLKSVKGMRMLSALAENAARKRAELGDLPKKTIKQQMYLVKWAGLGFEFCTWETKEDINDDALINRYHRLTESFPDEADMSEEILDKVIESTSHVNESNAGGVSCIPSLRAQLYAQVRSLQFTKHAITVPERVSAECGPSSRAVSEIEKSTQGSTSQSLVREVVECVADMLQRVERRLPVSVSLSNTCLPPPLSGEYDTIIPITGKGLMLNVGEVHGAVSFLGYRTFPDGTKGPAELRNLIRCVGDKIIAVDGVSTVGKSFKDVINMLRESGKNKFCYMRFLENSLAEQDLASTGRIGRYSVEQLQRKFTADRQRMVVQRSVHLVEAEAMKETEEKEESAAEDDSDSESDDGSEGEFQPDSDDEEMAAAPLKDEKDTIVEKSIAPVVSTPGGDDSLPTAPTELVTKDEIPVVVNPELDQPSQSEEASSIVQRQETTRSLAFRLLDIDVGYSSDEAGDEDHVYFLDGVDTTFTTMDEVTSLVGAKKTKAKTNAILSSIPARQNEFAALGERSKLTTAIALTSKPPAIEDFDHFPYPSSKEIEAMERKKKESEVMPSPSKTNRSTVKVAQVSVTTGDVVHVWANVESAAATLQLPINQLREVLRGEYNEEFGDEVGGYRWQYALAGAKVTAGAITETRGGGGKKAKEAWLEFRDKLYDPAEPHIYKNSNRLRDYQVDGVNWLASTWYKRQGCILADEMGCKWTL